MHRDQDIERELERRIEHHRKAALDEVLKDEPEKLESHMRQLAHYTELRKQIPAKRLRSLIPPLLVAAFCVLTAGWLWQTPHSPTRIALIVEASGIEIEPTSRLETRPDRVLGKSFSAVEIDSIRVSPGLDWQSTKIPDVVDLCHGQFILDKLEVDPNFKETSAGTPQKPNVIVQLSQPYMPRFFLKQASVLTDMRIWGDVSLSTGSCGEQGEPALTLPIELAETITMRIQGNEIIPGELNLPLNEGRALIFNDFDVNALKFVEEIDGPRGSIFVSTIGKARVTLPDIGTDKEFTEGAFLSMENFRGRVTEFRIDKHLHVVAEGTVTRISAGRAGFERDLTPSYLQYFSNNNQLALLWTALLFIWGLAWSTIRLFTK